MSQPAKNVGGAPVGNQNGARGKKWREAIVAALNDPKDPMRLHKIAERVVKAAMAGDPWAITEVGNRLDGKPKETVDIGVTQPVLSKPALTADEWASQHQAVIEGEAEKVG